MRKLIVAYITTLGLLVACSHCLFSGHVCVTNIQWMHVYILRAVTGHSVYFRSFMKLERPTLRIGTTIVLIKSMLQISIKV